MPLATILRSGSFWVVSSTLAIACGPAGDPLGGPYGGTLSSPVSPSSDDPGQDLGDGGEDGASGSSGGSATESSSGGSSAAAHSSSSSGGTTHSGSSSGSTTHSSASSSSGTASSSGSSSGSTTSGPAPTWSQIYAKYLARGTAANCANCHSQMSSAANAYSWLKSRGYINGTSSTLTSPFLSDLSWYGGNMPPGGGANAQAVTDMNAWVMAGALDI